MVRGNPIHGRHDTQVRSENRPRILSESRVDYKYRRILEGVPADYVCKPFRGLVRGLLARRPETPDVLHIRYLKWRGYLGTAFRYGLLIALCKLRGVRIVWSLHNIEEYNIPSRWYNAVARRFLATAADSIVVFDESLRKYLGRHAARTHVASFGEFRSRFESDQEESESGRGFLADYDGWLARRGDSGPHLVFVGAYALSKRIEALLEIARLNPDFSVVIVAPGMERPASLPGNVFLHAEWVGAELRQLLDRPDRFQVGFVGHGNVSVPTALYVYASFGIPVLALESPPVDRIVRNHDLGYTISDAGEARDAVLEMRRRIDAHRSALVQFLDEHSWANSALVHRTAFGLK